MRRSPVKTKPAYPRDWNNHVGTPAHPPQKAPQAPVEVPAPGTAQVVLPSSTCLVTALKRKAHRAPGEAPRVWDLRL